MFYNNNKEHFFELPIFYFKKLKICPFQYFVLPEPPVYIMPQGCSTQFKNVL